MGPFPECVDFYDRPLGNASHGINKRWETELTQTFELFSWCTYLFLSANSVIVSQLQSTKLSYCILHSNSSKFKSKTTAQFQLESSNIIQLHLHMKHPYSAPPLFALTQPWWITKTRHRTELCVFSIRDGQCHDIFQLHVTCMDVVHQGRMKYFNVSKSLFYL